MLMKIATVNSLPFKIPKNLKYSFFNSPYPAHRLGTAVDVYFEDKALFPFEEGIISEIKKIRTPKHVPIETDYLMVVKVEDLCLKVLHVSPSIRVGEKVYLGDEFGDLVVSGFFMPWSDKHVHFELRRCTDRYRARGALRVKPEILKLVKTIKGNRFEVIEEREYYYWLKPLKTRGENLTPLTYQGVPVEGGLPHYHYGVAFGDFEKIELFRAEVRQREMICGFSVFSEEFVVFANGQKVRGIGIYCNEERIKLIGGKFEKGDVVEIEISGP